MGATPSATWSRWPRRRDSRGDGRRDLPRHGDRRQAFRDPPDGRDTCRGDRLTLCLTVVGAVGRGKPVSRAGARPGDLLYVTGSPDVAAGARAPAPRASGEPSGWRREAMRAHLRPEARWREGRAAARSGAVAAMIDVSDGILTDLSHLLERDGLGAVLAEESFPVSRSFRAASAALGVDPLDAFLGGGEDYELLMAVRPARRAGFLRTARAFPRAPPSSAR